MPKGVYRTAATRTVEGDTWAILAGCRWRKRLGIALGGAVLCAPGAIVAIVDASSSTGGRSVFPSPDAVATCKALVEAYDRERYGIDRCTRDDECQAERRGGFMLALEGCWRFTNRTLSHERLDELASDWLALGCASDFDTCRAPRAAICQRGQCVERPPPDVPHDWVQREIRHWFSFYAPPHATQEWGQSECGFSYWSGGRDLLIDIAYGSLDAYENADESSILDHRTLDTPEGRAKYVRRKDTPHSEWSVSSIRYFQARAPYRSRQSLFAWRGSELEIGVRCRGAEACGEGELVLKSVRFHFE